MKVPLPIFQELEKVISADKLTQDTCRGMVDIGGKTYVATGAMSSASERDIEEIDYDKIWAQECVPFEQYEGEALTYSQRLDQKFKGYAGQLVFYRNEKYVLVGEPVTFYPTRTGQQFQIF